MHEMSPAVIEKVCIMTLNTNAGSRTNRNILRRGSTIPDPWRTILNRRYTGLGGRGYSDAVPSREPELYCTVLLTKLTTPLFCKSNEECDGSLFCRQNTDSFVHSSSPFAIMTRSTRSGAI